MDGALVRGAAEDAGVPAEVDALDKRLVGTSPELDQLQTGHGIKHPDEGAALAGSGQQGALDAKEVAIKVKWDAAMAAGVRAPALTQMDFVVGP